MKYPVWLKYLLVALAVIALGAAIFIVNRRLNYPANESQTSTIKEQAPAGITPDPFKPQSITPDPFKPSSLRGKPRGITPDPFRPQGITPDPFRR